MHGFLVWLYQRRNIPSCEASRPLLPPPLSRMKFEKFATAGKYGFVALSAGNKCGENPEKEFAAGEFAAQRQLCVIFTKINSTQLSVIRNVRECDIPSAKK